MQKNGYLKMSEKFIINTSEIAGIVDAKELETTELSIFIDKHPLLSKPVPEFVGELPNVLMTNLVNRLKITMKMYNGLGLSANQCGITKRVFVIGTDQFQIACINPKVISVSEELDKGYEGCLSFPALFLKIPRPKWVEAEYINENGVVTKTKFEGLSARCYLHEMEHMDGIKFTQHVGLVSMQQAKRKQEKMIKKITRVHK